MKKRLFVLLTSLFLTTLSFSQITYPIQLNDSVVAITVNQLKATNLIFLEHSKLKTEVAELNRQVVLYKGIIKNAAVQDSLNQQTVAFLNNALQEETMLYQREIKKLNRRRKVAISFGVALAVLLCLL